MRLLGRWLAVCMLIASAQTALTAQVGTVRYDVTVADPAAHRLHVAISVDPGKSGHVRFAMPAWTPGYYQILDFWKDVDQIHAQDAGGQDLLVNHPNDQTWVVDSGRGRTTISYDVKANDGGFGFFRCHVDEKTGYLNGAAALMYLVDAKQLPAVIAYHLPKGWRVACSLDPAGDDRFRAPDYDELIDCPAQMGDFERLDFSVKRTPFSAILVGSSDVDHTALRNTLSSIAGAAIDVFGYAPFKRYIFFIHMSPGSFGGGLEHRSCTVLNVWGRGARGSHPWANLAAHEYFHAWNVKRIHPAVLGPFDYTQKVRTGALWWAEGVTDYYADVLDRMAGITTPEQFLQAMAGEINSLQHTPARTRVTAEEASQKAWEGGSMGFGGLSYYQKGKLLGLLFDIEIRKATNNARSLDDVMRYLDARYGRRHVGYPENGLLEAINRVSGKDFTAEYDKYVRTTAEIPWEAVLADAGLRLVQSEAPKAYAGLSLSSSDGGAAVVDSVASGSPAEAAGIKAGDTVVRLDGKPIAAADWPTAGDALKPGQTVSLELRRDGKDVPATMTMGTTYPRVTGIEQIPDVSPDAARVRAGLLRSNGSKSGTAPDIQAAR